MKPTKLDNLDHVDTGVLRGLEPPIDVAKFFIGILITLSSCSHCSALLIPAIAFSARPQWHLYQYYFAAIIEV